MSGKAKRVEPGESYIHNSDSDEDDDGPARDNTLPDFLLNALVNNLERVNNENCPFEEYIDLEESAWGISNEARHLIIHKNYHDLINFVSNKFASWKPGTLVHSTITGTAGIGKSMFALYLARKLVENNVGVVLYYGDRFWAFTKRDGKLARTFLQNSKTKNGIKIFYAAGSRPKESQLLDRLLVLPNVVVIRDC